MKELPTDGTRYAVAPPLPGELAAQAAAGYARPAAADLSPKGEWVVYGCHNALSNETCRFGNDCADCWTPVWVKAEA